MFDDLDLAELGLELPEEKAAALKEALAAKAKEVVDKEVTGLKSKNAELLGLNKTIKSELEQFKGQFDGLDVDAVKGLLQKVNQDEEASLIAQGKIDEVVSKRTERLRGDYDKQLQAEREAREKAEAFANRFKDKALENMVRTAARKAGALPEAEDDIVLRARAAGFTLNEDASDLMAFSGEGETIYSKDGKTPLSIHEWMAESLREAAPHLWPRAQGAGPTGDKGAKGAKKRSDMTPEEMAAFIKEHGQAAYLKLPK